MYGGVSVNSASVIGSQGGLLGNPYDIYISAFDTFKSFSAVTTGVPNRPGVQYYSGEGLTDPGSTESFWSVFSKVISVAAPFVGGVVSVGLPLALGPLGAVLAPIAGVALNAAGKLAESGAGTESAIIGEVNESGAVERALLGECALQAVFSLGPDNMQKLGIDKTMARVTSRLSPTVDKVAPHLSTVLYEPALRLSLQQQVQPSLPLKEVKVGKRVPLPGANTSGTESGLDDNQSRFLRGLLGETVPVVGTTESFWGSVTGLLSTAISKAPAIISAAASGLNLINDIVNKGNQESGFDPAPAPISAVTFQGVAQRAMVGEAALQTLMELPSQEMEKIRGNQESLFDTTKKVLQTLGPIVIKAAPIVLDTVAPIVKDILASPKGSKPAEPSTTTAGGANAAVDGSSESDWDNFFKKQRDPQASKKLAPKVFH